MRTLKRLFAKYTTFIWMLLKPLGAWGVFAIGFIDSAFFGLPLDAVVAGYVYANARRAPLYILMAAAGSALGSSFIYLIGRKGGELLLEKRLGKARLERMRDRFEEHEFLALMLPAMLPPPTPFKAFLLAAAVFQMHFRDFLLAIFAGRVVRFTILAILTLVFGPQIVEFFGTVVVKHVGLSLALFCVGVLILVLYLRAQKRRRPRNSAAG